MFQMTPQTKVRALFYLVFTLFGLFHAEVLSRSQPWVLLNPLWFALVAPVYGVHYIVLGDLLLRKRATGFWPVFIAGCILGMYEFVITKVFWTPTWNPYAPQVMEVAWMETFYIGFWWHAFMSFAIPFFLVRKLLLEGHKHPLEIKEVRYILVAVPVVAAVFGVAFGSNLAELLFTILASMAVLLGASWYFLKKAPQWGFKGPDDVLLGPKGRRLGLVFVGAVYVFYGATMRPEAWPSLVGFVLPGLLYAALFLMFYPFVRTKGVAAVPPSTAQDPALAPNVAIPLRPAPQVVAAPAEPIEGLTRFFAPYAAVFVALIAKFQLIALLAPWVLFIMVIAIILSAGAAAFVLLAMAGRKSVVQWAARERPPAAA